METTQILCWKKRILQCIKPRKTIRKNISSTPCIKNSFVNYCKNKATISHYIQTAPSISRLLISIAIAKKIAEAPVYNKFTHANPSILPEIPTPPPAPPGLFPQSPWGRVSYRFYWVFKVKCLAYYKQAVKRKYLQVPLSEKVWTLGKIFQSEKLFN